MITWKDKLTPSEVAFMADLVDQVPEAMGARVTFELCLNKLAGTEAKAGRFRFAMVDPDAGDVGGTNDEQTAVQYAQDEESCYVIDMQERQVIQSNGDRDDIPEAS